MKDWSYLLNIADGKTICVERVRIAEDDVVIEGKLEPPPLAQLSTADQVFIAVFMKSHGSIKKMESCFGISYPTVKKRLDKIASSMEFVNISTGDDLVDDTLDRLEKCEITASEAISILAKKSITND